MKADSLAGARLTKHLHNLTAYIRFPELSLSQIECEILSGDLQTDSGKITFDVIEIGKHFHYPENENLRVAIFRDQKGQYYLGYCFLDEKKVKLTW